LIPTDRPAGSRRLLLGAVAAVIVGFHLYVAFSGLIPNLVTRPLHLVCALVWIMLIEPDPRQPRWLRVLGVAICLGGLAAALGIVFDRRELVQQYGALAGWGQIALALALILAVLELARRAIKAVLPSVALLVLLYGAFGQHLPGVLGHGGIPLDYFLGTLTITGGGLWGQLTGVSVDTISLFLILGALISAGQAGTGFMSFATQVAGRLPAGGAKVAVVGSAMYGTISGVAAANAASTGMVTIPAMKRLGYPPTLAAAVEAVASTGGQIMPPIMGAGVFVMAELLRRPYAEIMVAATLPALLFFFTAWAGIHVYARRHDLKGLPRDELPGWGLVLRTLPFFLVPFGILLGCLAFTTLTLSYAAIYASLASWALLVFGADGRPSLAGWLRRSEEALISAARQIAAIAAIIICAGVIVGVFNMTGLGVKLTSLILSLSGGELWAVLILTAVASLVLGMELPTTAAYVICVAVAGPALIEVGVPDLYAHLLVFWYALLCTITPPVCGNVFIAAGIADAPWLPVAWTALRLGIGLFVVPFGFVANPSMLMLQSDPLLAVAATVKVGLGLALISFAAIGTGRRPWLRPLALAAGLACVVLAGF